MARVVILSFRDNQAAEAFCVALTESQDGNWRHETTRPNTVGIIVASSAKLEALLARPTKGCHCRATGKNHKVGWTRTSKFGWFVHTGCNRPSPLVVRDFMKNLIISAGNNLLPLLFAEHKADVHVMPTHEHITVGSRTDHGNAITATEGGDIDAQVLPNP